MSESPTKKFDCVQSMREARDRLSAEIETMTYDELVEWLRAHRYEDPLLEELAANAGQRGDGAELPWAGRRSAARQVG